MYVGFLSVNTAIFELCMVLMDCCSHAIPKQPSALTINSALGLGRVV